MRNQARIPVILEIFKREDVQQAFLLYHYPGLIQAPLELKRSLHRFEENLCNGILESYWTNNCDLRLIQATVNLSITPHWAHYHWVEETDFLLQNELVEPRDVLLWGNRVSIDGTPLDTTNWLRIRDIGTDHLRAILRDYGNSGKLSDRYKTCMELEVYNREHSEVTV